MTIVAYDRGHACGPQHLGGVAHGPAQERQRRRPLVVDVERQEVPHLTADLCPGPPPGLGRRRAHLVVDATVEGGRQPHDRTLDPPGQRQCDRLRERDALALDG